MCCGKRKRGVVSPCVKAGALNKGGKYVLGVCGLYWVCVIVWCMCVMGGWLVGGVVCGYAAYGLVVLCVPCGVHTRQ